VFLVFHFSTNTREITYERTTKASIKDSVLSSPSLEESESSTGYKNIYELASCYMCFTLLLFILFNSLVSNPFTPAPHTASEGYGLNPILQDIAVSVHPPILYTGYSIIILCYSLVMAGIVSLQAKSKTILEILKAWNFLAWCLITLGVTLGSWWAYRELGWGGFWFFDPVENISLLPWITSLMSMHLLKLSTIDKAYTNCAQCSILLSLFMLLFGSLLVRSGLLTSVHSFAIASWNIIGFGVIIFLLLATYVRHKKKYLLMTGENSLKNDVFIINSSNGELMKAPAPTNQSVIQTSSDIITSEELNSQNTPSLSSKTGGVILSQSLLLGTLLSLLIGIILPILSPAFSGNEIFLGPSYYYTSFLPFFPALLIIAAFTSYGDWNKPITKDFMHIHLTLFAICVAVAYFAFIIADSSNIPGLGLIAASAGLYLFISSLLAWIRRFSYNISSILGHLGFSVLVLSIVVIANFTQEANLSLKASQSQNFTGNTIVKLEKIRYSAHANYFRHITELQFTDDYGNEITRLEPERRLYVPEMTNMSETALYSSMLYDIGAVITDVSEEIISFRIFYKPGMFFLWLSGFLLFYSGFINFFNAFSRKRI
jgi:cytochrome c-type biogenesis protein CcmF